MLWNGLEKRLLLQVVINGDEEFDGLPADHEYEVFVKPSWVPLLTWIIWMSVASVLGNLTSQTLWKDGKQNVWLLLYLLTHENILLTQVHISMQRNNLHVAGGLERPRGAVGKDQRRRWGAEQWGGVWSRSSQLDFKVRFISIWKGQAITFPWNL